MRDMPEWELNLMDLPYVQEEMEKLKLWKKEHNEAHAAHQRKYRATHREQTLAQWKKDTAAYRERMAQKDPERLKERDRISSKKAYEKRKALMKAIKEMEEQEKKMREAELKAIEELKRSASSPVDSSLDE